MFDDDAIPTGKGEWEKPEKSLGPSGNLSLDNWIVITDWHDMDSLFLSERTRQGSLSVTGRARGTRYNNAGTLSACNGGDTSARR